MMTSTHDSAYTDITKSLNSLNRFAKKRVSLQSLHHPDVDKGDEERPKQIILGSSKFNVNRLQLNKFPAHKLQSLQNSSSKMHKAESNRVLPSLEYESINVDSGRDHYVGSQSKLNLVINTGLTNEVTGKYERLKSSTRINRNANVPLIRNFTPMNALSSSIAVYHQKPKQPTKHT